MQGGLKDKANCLVANCFFAHHGHRRKDSFPTRAALRLRILDPFRAAVTGSDTKAHRPQSCRPFRVNPDCRLATFRRRRSLQNCPHYKRRRSELQQENSPHPTIFYR